MKISSPSNLMSFFQCYRFESPRREVILHEQFTNLQKSIEVLSSSRAYIVQVLLENTSIPLRLAFNSSVLIQYIIKRAIFCFVENTKEGKNDDENTSCRISRDALVAAQAVVLLTRKQKLIAPPSTSPPPLIRGHHNPTWSYPPVLGRIDSNCV